jgi:hypothetical protein
MRKLVLGLLLLINIGCVIPETRVRVGVIVPVGPSSCTQCHLGVFTGPYIHSPRWIRPHYYPYRTPHQGFKVYR